MRAGTVGWCAILTISFARLALAVSAQGVSALVLLARGEPRPFVAAADWFTVHGTLVDLGSIALLVVLLRREGLRFTDLFRARLGPRLRVSLALVPLILVALVAVGMTAGAVTGLLVAGDPTPAPPVAYLPTWAGLYSTLVWPLIWGFVEQATYDGYAAPRALALSRWALVVVALGWAAQHLALPLRFDAAFLALRFFPSLAVAVASMAIYLRTRNLLPLALAHWLVDLFTGAMTLAPSTPWDEASH